MVSWELVPQRAAKQTFLRPRFWEGEEVFFFFCGCGRALFKSAFESAGCWEGKQRLGWGFVGTWRRGAGSDEIWLG